MSTPLLKPLQIPPYGPIFTQILSWPFHETYVSRILRSDIPQRAAYGNVKVWVYEDSNKEIVGFGTIDVCLEYSTLTNGQPHAYIPLLGVHPTFVGRGYGRYIVDHLIGEAVLLARQPQAQCCDQVFLDVYVSNARAIFIYEQKGFVKLGPPILDPKQNEYYFIMARGI